jgi:hypothetical protein
MENMKKFVMGTIFILSILTSIANVNGADTKAINTTITSVLFPYVFAKGGDGAIWYRGFTDNIWGDWQSIGGSSVSDPDASDMCVRGHCYVHAFVRGQDNALWAREWDYGGATPFWRDWYSYGGSLTSSPGVATVNHLGDPETYIFARGTDNALWYRSWREEGSWGRLGGALTSGPGTIGNGAYVYVFVRGTDNAVWYRMGEIHDDLSFTWGSWSSLGGNIVSDPDALILNDGKIAAVARGTDNAVWYRTYGGTWSNWEKLGGATMSSPGGGRYNDVLVRGTDNALWRKEFGGQDWTNLGGILASGPGMTS